MTNLDQNDIDTITRQVILKLSEKYLLVEKTFNLNPNMYSEKKTKAFAFIENVIFQACQFYGLHKNDLDYGQRIKNKYAHIVSAIIYLCRVIPEEAISSGLIGEFYKKDHATILHRETKCLALMQKDNSYCFEVNQIRKLVENSLKL